jgi:Tol biopolymer transport system component
MKPILTSIILVTFLAVGNINSLIAQTPEQLYQKGLTKEEGEGVLQDAIALYNQVADNSNAIISLRAKALLHIGMCYEKLGMQEAVKAYQRLVNNFPGQKNEVAVARERLNKLATITEKASATSLTPKFTKIKIPTKLSWSIKLSPDGHNLALVSDSKLWVMPLSGNIGPDFPGKPIQLNTEGVSVEWSGLAWSGDGKWIAFNEELDRKNLVEKPEKEKYNQGIFIVPSNGGKPKKVIENYRDARVVNYRISLSPDASKLAYTSVENNEQHIYITQVDGGSPKKLIDIQAREPVFSPDGKMIALVEDKNLGRGEGGLGLWVTPAQGGIPHLLAKAKTASSPIWSPDGSMIAFIDNSNNKLINFVQVPKDLGATGKVTSIDAPESSEEVTLLAGWTPDNKLGLLVTAKREFSLYTLPAIGGQAAIISNDCYAFQPRWSRDGKQIFYITPPKEGDNKFYRLTLASVSASGGIGKPLLKEHNGKVIGQLAYQSGNRISPDGKMILSSAYTSADTMGVSEWPNSKIWKISIDGTESKQLTNHEGRYADMCPSWSPDGEKIAFVRASLKDDLLIFDKVSIYIISSSGGEAKMLIPETDKYIFSPVWSPDGKMIAYLTKDKETISEAPTSRYMNVVNVENGSIRVVGEVPKAHVNIEIAWSPDSRRIAFNDDNVIKVMNIDNGKIEDIKTNLVDVEIWHLDWSPDGEQFVFAGMKGGNAEFWFLEDFLPLEKMVQKNETVKLE